MPPIAQAIRDSEEDIADADNDMSRDKARARLEQLQTLSLRSATEAGEKQLGPHPEEPPSWGGRLEGWQRVHTVHPSFETARIEIGCCRFRHC